MPRFPPDGCEMSHRLNILKTSPPQPVVEPASDGFAECLRRIEQGPWRFVQLRGEWPASGCVIPDNDVDLLGSCESVARLIDSAWQWTREGLCHLQIVRGRSAKTQMTLWSRDGCQLVMLDLWMELNQLNAGRNILCYEDCLSAVVASGTSIARLQPDLESCVYLHHLSCKRRDLSAPLIQQRLAHYVAQCRRDGHTDSISLADALQRTQDDREISGDVLAMTLRHLQQKIVLRPAAGLGKSLRERWHSFWLGKPRRTTLISVIGCDGVGKTSLAHRLAADQPKRFDTVTGKHLYRKSLTYKIAVVLLRPLLTRSRETFDEQLAPLIFLRAATALRLLACRNRIFGRTRVTLIDRCIDDFLFADRKTDTPRFVRAHWLARLFGIRIPIIHLLVSQDRLKQRKQEVTDAGHAAYDNAMLRRLINRCPTDYTAFHNNTVIETAADALERILQHRSRNSEQ